eukprot:TRINITY_DN3592_c0_g2_i3.p1 TRINITY_DN3592_c0_g2~~TRINITY_DN3592_c0_g2_i3.p1  ORF type:complete len:224 (+),score=56.98 TRINITY_DN3592_c0_g2_i3:153-824(+)
MIIYALVARGSLVLAEFTNVDGDFPTVARKLIAKSAKSKLKKTMLRENYAFTYFNEDEFTFLCMTESTFSRETTSKFLDALANAFYSEYDQGNSEAKGKSLATHFTGVIKKLMEEYSGSTHDNLDHIVKIERDLEDVTEIAKSNIDKMVERGMQLDSLLDKTKNLKYKADSFKSYTKKIKNQMWWDKYRSLIYLFILVLGLFILPYFFLRLGASPAPVSNSSP